jgi:hypothetical protein
MYKYVTLVASSVMIVLAIWQITYAFLPKTGPIGNGPNMFLVWFLPMPTLIARAGGPSLYSER